MVRRAGRLPRRRVPGARGRAAARPCHRYQRGRGHAAGVEPARRAGRRPRRPGPPAARGGWSETWRRRSVASRRACAASERAGAWRRPSVGVWGWRAGVGLTAAATDRLPWAERAPLAGCWRGFDSSTSSADSRGTRGAWRSRGSHMWWVAAAGGDAALEDGVRDTTCAAVNGIFAACARE